MVNPLVRRKCFKFPSQHLVCRIVCIEYSFPDDGAYCELVCMLCPEGEIADLIYDIYLLGEITPGPPMSEMLSCHEKFLLLLFPMLNPVLIDQILGTVSLAEFLSMPSDELW